MSVFKSGQVREGAKNMLRLSAVHEHMAHPPFPEEKKSKSGYAFWDIYEKRKSTYWPIIGPTAKFLNIKCKIGNLKSDFGSGLKEALNKNKP